MRKLRRETIEIDDGEMTPLEAFRHVLSMKCGQKYERYRCDQHCERCTREHAELFAAFEANVSSGLFRDLTKVRKKIHEAVRHRCGWLGRKEGDCRTNHQTEGLLCVNRVSCDDATCPAVKNVIRAAEEA